VPVTTIDDLDLPADAATGWLEPVGVGEVAVPAVDVTALLAASVSVNTARNYRQDWTRFVEWCTQHGYVALPAAPATVAAYLQDRPRSTPSPGSAATRSRR